MLQLMSLFFHREARFDLRLLIMTEKTVAYVWYGARVMW
jgi:hypothetical protein